MLGHGTLGSMTGTQNDPWTGGRGETEAQPRTLAGIPSALGELEQVIGLHGGTLGELLQRIEAAGLCLPSAPQVAGRSEPRPVRGSSLAQTLDERTQNLRTLTALVRDVLDRFDG